VSRASAALGLILRFLAQVVRSGIAIARLILAGGPAPWPGLVRYPYPPMSERGAALLGALITLTPGTTTIDIDPGRREMLLHLLDAAGAEQALASIRRDFEGRVAALFPPEA
jgi:multisubunit Na+/H+ antiporter MnhE subunit